MRRALFAILALLLLGTVAHAGVVIAPKPTADPAANRRALQAAFDASARDGDGVVKFGAGIWVIDGPLFLDRSANDHASVSLIGEGRGVSKIQMRRGLGFDVLVIGCDRRPRWPGGPANGAALTADHFVSTKGLLDASAWGRWAYRSRGDTHLAQMGGALDQGLGDWYGKTRRLTLDIAFVLNDAASAQDAVLCGVGTAKRAGPLTLQMLGGGLYLVLTTVGPDPSDPESTTSRRFYVGPKLAAGLHRATIMVDADTPGMFVAWVDGKLANTQLQQGPPPKAGESLAANQHSPFAVGSQSDDAGGVIDFGGAARDVTFAGLKVTAAALYDPAKDAPTRADGKPLTDAVRYFADEPGTLIGCLPFTDAPADACASRVLSVAQPWAPGQAVSRGGIYCLDNVGHASTFSGYQAAPIRDLAIEAGGDGGPYGRAVALGIASGASFRDCRFLGGAHGIGSLSLGASYPLAIDDCRLRGADAPLSLHLVSSATARRLLLEGTYRAAIRLRGSTFDLDGLFSPHWGTPEYGVCARESSIRLRGVVLDAEGSGGSQVADVYVTPIGDQPISVCEVDGFDGVGSGPKSSKLLLGGSVVRPNVTARVRNWAVNDGFPVRSVVRCLTPGLWNDGGIVMSRSGGDPKALPPGFEGAALLKPATTTPPVVAPPVVAPAPVTPAG
jgi:hypothetical protein